MIDQEQVDFAVILKAFAEKGFNQPYKHLHIIVYNDDYTFDSISLLHQDENKVLFSKEDAQKLLTIMMQDYNEIAMEYGYLKSFNA